MFWFEVWECLMKRKKPVLTEEQAKYLPQLEERAAAMKRLEARRDRHKKKYKTMPKKSAWVAFFDEKKMLYKTAKYFERYYDENFQKMKEPRTEDPQFSGLGTDSHNSIAYLTKNKNYLYRKCKRNIERALAEKKKAGENYTFDSFLLDFYLRIPTCAFDSKELAVICEMFQFAQNKKLIFHVKLRRTRKDTEKLKKTYSEFCDWYAKHKNEYSCNDRYFVSLFCKNDTFILQENISSLFVSNLLRYDIFPDCFIENDLKAMGVRKNAKLFFKVMKQIRETSQKK